MRSERYHLKTEQEALGLEISSFADLNAEIDALFAELERTGDAALLEDLCPYFGVVWPSARGLAEQLVELGSEALAGKSLLEVGCGLGVPSLVAARLGARVVATDFHPDIQWFLERNIKANGIEGLTYVRRDWRENPKAPSLGLFDWVIGSDILYERQHPAPVARLLVDHLALNGRIVLADPGRPYLQAFADEIKALGFECEIKNRNVQDRPGPDRKDIFILEIRPR